MVELGYCDDDAVWSRVILMNILESQNISNMFVCLSRIEKRVQYWRGQIHTHLEYKNNCKEVYQSEDIPEEPIFNNIIF